MNESQHVYLAISKRGGGGGGGWGVADKGPSACVRFVRSLIANQEVPGSISGWSRVNVSATFFHHTSCAQGLICSPEMLSQGNSKSPRTRCCGDGHMDEYVKLCVALNK